MLVTQRDINDARPPLLMIAPTGDWKLVASALQMNDCLKLDVIEKNVNKLRVRSINLDETPFYVGADIWELEYGTRLVTLHHISYKQHPAQKIWEKWIQNS